MDRLGLNDVREAYLKFFESKQHLRLPSFSLIPQNDKSLLLINAGMAPLKPYFTGLQVPPSKRVTTCQKCIRTGDIDNVGITSRHATFFEMLGNFSFGDYFKKEIIPWSWEFVTEVLKLPKDKLYVTIYLDDDEALKIWTESTDIDIARIFRLGKDDNFWEIGQGPCGPCSEIHFDRGEGKINSVEEFVQAGEEDRVVEFWNLVFTQFDKDENGNYNKLAHPNIDTGMGLERIATIMQGKKSIFEVDTMEKILNRVSQLSNVKYGEDEKTDISIRIITDHIRSTTFMISDDILPSNEGRGYVLRRLLRRAARHGKLLGIDRPFLYELCDVVIENSYKAYPELKSKESYIKKVIQLEEERFSETIDSGMDILKSYIKETEENNEDVLSGIKAFKLYDTYGFPVELTSEILMEKNIKVNMDEFNKEMKEQKQRARNARQETNYMGSQMNTVDNIPNSFKTIFDGYDRYELTSPVRFIIKGEEFVQKIVKGEKGIIVTEKTPFYAEMGGQIGDKGLIYNDSFKALVLDTKKNINGNIIHYIHVIYGELNIDSDVILKIDENIRKNTCRNHTATHMLDEALREVLGKHVHQTGSFVSNERLRFDFSHFQSMTEEELKDVESIVNKKIMECINVKTDIMSLEEAKSTGAIALFDDKYADSVRVVTVGHYSKELCGGTHVNNSGEIGMFKIISESGIAAGVRRIEAVVGSEALLYFNSMVKSLNCVESSLKCSEKEIVERIDNLQDQLKEKDKEIQMLKGKIASNSEEDLINSAIEIKGIKIVKGVLKDIDSNALRNLGDKIKDKIGEGIVVLGSSVDDKVQLIAMATKGAVSRGAHCGKIIKEVAAITGGGGGGRPDMAQAGGKDASKLKEAIEKVDIIAGNLIK